jgi:hypothetical protein
MKCICIMPVMHTLTNSTGTAGDTFQHWQIPAHEAEIPVRKILLGQALTADLPSDQ